MPSAQIVTENRCGNFCLFFEVWKYCHEVLSLSLQKELHATAHIAHGSSFKSGAIKIEEKWKGGLTTPEKRNLRNLL